MYQHLTFSHFFPRVLTQRSLTVEREEAKRHGIPPDYILSCCCEIPRLHLGKGFDRARQLPSLDMAQWEASMARNSFMLHNRVVNPSSIQEHPCSEKNGRRSGFMGRDRGR